MLPFIFNLFFSGIVLCFFEDVVKWSEMITGRSGPGVKNDESLRDNTEERMTKECVGSDYSSFLQLLLWSFFFFLFLSTIVHSVIELLCGHVSLFDFCQVCVRGVWTWRTVSCSVRPLELLCEHRPISPWTCVTCTAPRWVLHGIYHRLKLLLNKRLEQHILVLFIVDWVILKLLLLWQNISKYFLIASAGNKSSEAATEGFRKVLSPSWNMLTGFQIMEQLFMLLIRSLLWLRGRVCGSSSKSYITSLHIYSLHIRKRVISRWKFYRTAPPSLKMFVATLCSCEPSDAEA